MTIKEMSSAKDNEIIYEYIRSYSHFAVKLNLGGGIEKLSKHLKSLDSEMLKRGILTKEQIDYLNS